MPECATREGGQCVWWCSVILVVLLRVGVKIYKTSRKSQKMVRTGEEMSLYSVYTINGNGILFALGCSASLDITDKFG